MLERIEAHQQALALARMLQRPHTTIRFANNGQFEKDREYFFDVWAMSL